MRTLPLSTGPGRMLRHSRYTLSRLKSNAKAKALVPALDVAHKALKAAQLASNDADDVVMDARGPVAEVDGQVGELLVALQLDLLKAVAKNYNDPMYTALFPKGLGEVRRQRGLGLAAELARLEQTLATQGKTSPLAAYLPRLQAAQKEWQAPLAGLKTATAAQVQAGNVLDKAKHDWTLAYDAVYGHLRALFPGKKNLVESFFLAVDTPRKGKAAAPAEPVLA